MAETCPKCHGPNDVIAGHPHHEPDSEFCLKRQLAQAKADSAKWEQMYLEEWKAGEDARAENVKRNLDIRRMHKGLNRADVDYGKLRAENAKLLKAQATAKAEVLREVRLAVAKVRVEGLTENDEIIGQQDMKDRILEELRRVTAEAEKDGGE